MNSSNISSSGVTSNIGLMSAGTYLKVEGSPSLSNSSSLPSSGTVSPHPRLLPDFTKKLAETEHQNAVLLERIQRLERELKHQVPIPSLASSKQSSGPLTTATFAPILPKPQQLPFNGQSFPMTQSGRGSGAAASGTTGTGKKHRRVPSAETGNTPAGPPVFYASYQQPFGSSRQPFLANQQGYYSLPQPYVDTSSSFPMPIPLSSALPPPYYNQGLLSGGPPSLPNAACSPKTLAYFPMHDTHSLLHYDRAGNTGSFYAQSMYERPTFSGNGEQSPRFSYFDDTQSEMCPSDQESIFSSKMDLNEMTLSEALEAASMDPADKVDIVSEDAFISTVPPQGLNVYWEDPQNYPDYFSLHGTSGFEPDVNMLDQLLNTDPYHDDFEESTNWYAGGLVDPYTGKLLTDKDNHPYQPFPTD